MSKLSGGFPTTAATPGLSTASGRTPARSVEPSKRMTRSASSLVAGSALALSPFATVTTPSGSPSKPSAHADSPATVRRTMRAPDSWSLVDEDGEGHINVVSARSHEQKLSRCSWLHAWEHARALHVGVRQGDVTWDTYAYRPTPDLKKMLAYLQDRLPIGARLEAPRESLYTEIPLTESVDEVNAAFKLGTVHFTGELNLDIMSNRPVLKLCPASAGLGSHLYRKYGSDRFFRLKLDDKIARAGAPSRGDAKADRLADAVKTFLDHPLRIFGRQYRSFCLKDGALVYWCESGPGLDTVSLVDFSEKYIDTSINSSMSVAKWTARFELGLTTTIPTVTFKRNEVFRTPDLFSDSLVISYAAMLQICSLFQVDAASADECMPHGYVPSAIRGAYWSVGSKTERVDTVWRLDYSTCPQLGRPPSSSTLVSIQARPLGPSKLRPTTLSFSFELKKKDGSSVTTQYRARGNEVDYVNPATETCGVVMTDGCSLMSYAAMEEVHRILVEVKGEGEVGRGLPAAAQGRLGPGKGVWAIAPDHPWGTSARFIEVRDSQWKFNDQQIDVFTFELHSIPSAKTSAKLGKQTFEVLAHCGVPNGVFRSLLRTHLEQVTDLLYDWSDLPKLLYHIEKTTSVLEDRVHKARLNCDPGVLKTDSFDEEGERGGDDAAGFVHDGRLDGSSGAPNTINELVVELLQTGFDPDGTRKNSSPLLAAKLAWIAEDQVRQNVSFKLTSEQCRTALVVADHLGVLKEGEIFYQASEPIVHQRRTSHVVLGDVLITRPPAVQPCDVQKMRAVFCPEYASVTDLIVMSSFGERPACSILSGGDYDGDKLLIISDPAIVNAFDPSKADPTFADPPFADEDWFEVDKRRVATTIAPLIASKDSGAISQHLISGFYQDVKYGMLSKLHTKLAFTLGLDHPDTSTCGHLFARALDGRKQGLKLESKWPDVQSRFRASEPLPEWTYLEDGKINAELGTTKFATRGKGLGKHVMDELVSEGRSALRRAKVTYHSRFEGWIATVDDHLASLWRSSWGLACERQQQANGDDPLFLDLSRILRHIQTVFADYKAMRTSWMRARDRRAQTEKGLQAPGSPSKSPSKWKGGSSAEQKKDLVAITKVFWSLLTEGEEFASPELAGVRGSETARALMASCAYIEPLEPTRLDLPGQTTSAPRTLLDRLKAASPAKSTTSTTTSRTSPSPNLTTPSASAPMDVDAPPPPSDEEDEFDFSQLPSEAPFTQLAQAALDKTRPSSTPVTATTTPLSPSKAASSTRSWSQSFQEAGKNSKTTFCFDMAHRDVLALKADALAAASHGGAKGAKGIQARKFAPEMADAISINRRLAGIHKAHSKVRPITLLSPEDLAERPSPSKKAKTL